MKLERTTVRSRLTESLTQIVTDCGFRGTAREVTLI